MGTSGDRRGTKWLGGPPQSFEAAGREQLEVLVEHGLEPSSRVVDIGCGALRGGVWIIPRLDPGHYFGVEPNRELLQTGLDTVVPADVLAEKQPRFSHDATFDLSEFGTTFTHFLMRSVWTHASKEQIEASLDAFVRWGAPGAVLLSSHLEPGLSNLRHGLGAVREYRGRDWRGRSHESRGRAMVAHSLEWIRGASAARGLQASRVERPPLNRQRWVAVRRAEP